MDYYIENRNQLQVDLHIKAQSGSIYLSNPLLLHVFVLFFAMSFQSLTACLLRLWNLRTPRYIDEEPIVQCNLGMETCRQEFIGKSGGIYRLSKTVCPLMGFTFFKLPSSYVLSKTQLCASWSIMC